MSPSRPLSWKQLLKLAVVALALAAPPAWATNLVQDGNFATGGLTDWTSNDWGVGSYSPPFTPPPGDSFYAFTGCIGPQCITGQQASLSQTLLTTNGDTYTLTFDFTTFGNSTPNELDVLWDGVSVLDLGPGGTLGPISTWTEYTVTGLVGDGADTLTFLGRQDPGRDGLDDVDVEISPSTTATPEPATFWMIGSALPALSILGRRWSRS